MNIEPRNKPFDYQGNEIIIDNEEIRNFQYKLDKKIKINASLTTCEAAFGVGLATFDPDTSESFGGIPANKSIIGVPGNCKFYITANENCGMINIGHCNTTNEYEMKLLINTIFFLHNQNKQ
ncbi:hypothetical protein TRFO_17155 [Tritrichomonas foetus]|uniref:Uncharacterized protein n=1 Tax=Tritrichomonas foetus TaxID=1144522 RepID=A0A1J4KSX1_9EUKA|nr:hypothetical protein TRFO_17155 [Tritrichomonas foetus]|eukprot:OHT12884.1 hypothetical protein TRFO_17155 [Tritrichomonas foetus]